VYIRHGTQTCEADEADSSGSRNATASTLHNRHLDVVSIYPDDDDDDDDTPHSVFSPFESSCSWLDLLVARAPGRWVHDDDDDDDGDSRCDRSDLRGLSLSHLSVSSWGAVPYAV
jgi:hypothetical protein